MKNQIEPCLIIIFGATGDLTHRKLIPALFRLESDKLLHNESRIIAFARKPKENEDIRDELLGSVKKYSKFRFNDIIWKKFSKKIFYHQSEFQDLRGYSRLKKLISKICHRSPTKCNKLFYLATSPSFFETIVINLLKCNMMKSSKQWARVVFEKPFGHDLKSAIKLNKSIKKAFSEDQIYRIDHYLGKELVQNLLILRFSNSIFEPIWNKKHIDHVQITVSENLGVETRGNYYDKVGALRDMIQNHMLQLLTLTAMEPPVSLKADDIREEKVKVLRSIRSFSKSDVKKIAVRGQYSSGFMDSKKVRSYKSEDKVNKKSNTETFVALKLNIDNWRWSNVPFYLRTGKRLKEKIAEINIVFKQNSNVLFSDHIKELDPNMLVIRIQPEEGISLQFSAKVPGKNLEIDTVRMDFCHECKFGPNTPEAYEKLLLNSILGDQTLFTRWDEVEYAWKIVDKISEAWKKDSVLKYKPGSWGPKEADRLIKKDKRKWYLPQKALYSDMLQNNIP